MSFFIDIEVIPVKGTDDAITEYGVKIDTNLSNNDFYKVLSDIVENRENDLPDLPQE